MPYLSHDNYLVHSLVESRAVFLVLIVEDELYAGLCDARLALLVNEVLKVLGTYL